MDNQQQQVNQQPQQTDQEEDNRLKWLITQDQSVFLHKIREQLLTERAYEVLNMSQETMFSAAQANGFSRGRLALIDELLTAAQVIRIN